MGRRKRKKINQVHNPSSSSNKRFKSEARPKARESPDKYSWITRLSEIIEIYSFFQDNGIIQILLDLLKSLIGFKD